MNFENKKIITSRNMFSGLVSEILEEEIEIF